MNEAIYPKATFSGKIQVINKDHDVQSALEILIKSPVIGFDTETRPSFRKG